jgi:hypothetical protein
VAQDLAEKFDTLALHRGRGTDKRYWGISLLATDSYKLDLFLDLLILRGSLKIQFLKTLSG